MLFMGTELMTGISWDNYYGYNAGAPMVVGEEMNWFPAAGSKAAGFKKLVKTINGLRLTHTALRGNAATTAIVHEDPVNGVIGFKRWDNTGCVLLILVNISDDQWEQNEYKVQTQTPGTDWKEIFNSQDEIFGGWPGSGNPSAVIHAGTNGNTQGINLPKWSLIILKQQ